MEKSDDPLIPAAHTHDGFFKSVFSQTEHATAFFKSHLPPGIVRKIDWPSLTRVPGSFVKSSLQQLHSDLLFSCRLGGRETRLYLLFEHQSTPDPAIRLRLAGYTMQIHQQHYRQHGLPLIPVLPFVLHQGPESWKPSTAFEDLFELPEDLAADLLPFLPKFQHALLDLTGFDPATGEDDTRLRVVLQLMKLARQKELLRFFQWLAGYPAEAFPEHLLGKMLLYALHTDSDLDVEEIYHKLSTNPELERNTMSVAEKLKAQGRQEGRLQALRDNIIEALEIRLGTLPAGLREEIQTIAEEAKLHPLHRAAIQCPTLEAFSAEL